MINKLRGIFDSQVVRTFSKKAVEVTFKEEPSLVFEEDSRGSALKKLSIIDKGSLVNQQLADTVIIEADFATGEHSKYSRFIKHDAFFLTKQCDFFILHQKDDKLYVAVCDMKSSKAGDDERCAQQIKHAEFFLTYILDAAIHAESYKKQADVAITEYVFIKLLFIPQDGVPIAMPLAVNIEDDDSNQPFEMDGKTHFHLLDMENGGTHATEQWRNIERRFPV